MIINADLHVHSKYSMATSKNMIVPVMAKEASKKGLNLIATGDAFHSKWLEHLNQSLTEIGDTGIYTTDYSNTKFIITVELEDNERIHHLLIIPSLETAHEMRNDFKVKNMDADGRPKIRMNGEEIINIARNYNCIIGPAHIFTPWTGIYKSYDSIEDCYNQKPDFVELGLSSDTNLADTINELHSYTFLTNSDSHSPWPHRIGREFNQIELDKLSFKDLQKSIKNNKIMKNFGINPLMGKYHETACIKCFKKYTIKEAVQQDMKCICGGRIKKGVKGRIEELSNYNIPKHPKNRPHYQYIMPLAELLSTAHNKGITTKYVQTRYDNLISIYSNEINVLLNVDIKELENIDSKLSKLVDSYRNNKLKIVSGGGGQYGSVVYE